MIPLHYSSNFRNANAISALCFCNCTPASSLLLTNHDKSSSLSRWKNHPWRSINHQGHHWLKYVLWLILCDRIIGIIFVIPNTIFEILIFRFPKPSLLDNISNRSSNTDVSGRCNAMILWMFAALPINIILLKLSLISLQFFCLT